jgi:hypothetical protein
MSTHPKILALEKEIDALQNIVETQADTLKQAIKAFTETSAELVTLLRKLARERQAEILVLIFELVEKLAYGHLAILGNVLGLKDTPSVDTLEKTVRGLNMEDITAAEKVNVIYARLNLLKPK